MAINKIKFAQGVQKFAYGVMGFSSSFGVGETVMQAVSQHPFVAEGIGIVSGIIFATSFVMLRTAIKLEDEVRSLKRQ